MKYSIHKDRQVVDTISYIKSILDSLSLNVKIKYFKYEGTEASSCRIFLSDIEADDIGTNGKGTCLNNALASGYAEFMERLQTFFLLDFSGNFYQEADEILLPREEIKSSVCYKDFSRNPKIEQYLELLNKLMYKKKDKKFDQSNEVFIPFISVKTKEKVYIPAMPLFITLGSNGFSAGNTIKEALVQGLSEICERNILNDIFDGKVIFGDIPQDVYNKYEQITNMIDFIEKNGYKVTIKDISTDKKFPVIATFFEDTELGITEIKLGASPYFTIAVERTLTEFLQGYSIDDPAKKEIYRKMFVFGGEYVDGVMQNSTKSCIFFQKNAKKFEKCFSRNKKFNKDIFLWDDNSDNETAYKFLVDAVLKVADDIYIRDYTIFGFPTVVIYVPQVSPLYEIYEEKVIDCTLHYLKWDLFFQGIDVLEDKSIDSLLRASKLRNLSAPRFDMKLSSIPSEIISLLCHIIKKDYKEIKNSLETTLIIIDDLASKESREKCKKFFTPIKKYYDLFFEGLEEEQIVKKFQNKNEYTNVKKIIDNYSFEQLLSLLQKHHSIINNKERMRPIINNLHKIYVNNLPNQEKLREIL